MALVLAGGAGSLRAQARAKEPEGALFLLVPVGARAVGLGQAMAAGEGGTESVWWNPAGLARQPKREAAIHHSQTIIGTGDALAVAVPSALLGTLALSASILDYGDQAVTNREELRIGTLFLRSFVFGATYATSVGERINAGLTYKLLQFRVDCSGTCPPTAVLTATASAVDAGVQYTLRPELPLDVGAAVRNLGPRLQVNDRDQSDPLPRRLYLGARYEVTAVSRELRGTALQVVAEVVDDFRAQRPSPRVGAEFAFQKRARVRGGYVFDESGTGAGPAVGLGLSTGGLVIDLARVFEGFSTDAGQPPTYLSLRYLF